MAYKRVEFKNKVKSHLTGAIIEFYKARLATKNGQTRWIEHWTTEVRLLVLQLVGELFHAVRGFTDRQKAYAEVVEDVRSHDANFRRYATNTIKRDYELIKLRNGLDANDTADFWALIDDAVRGAFVPARRR
jgi:hypothetical protein